MQALISAQRVAIVVAHPDDEVIGCGGLLPSLREVTIIHTTDGSPQDLEDARRNGYRTRDEYATARRQELECALHLAGVSINRVVCLGFTDKETLHHLTELSRRLADALTELRPEVVLTQPYEGGHPDHDSTAFAVHRAFPGQIMEMTAYHARGGALETGVFLQNGETPVVNVLGEQDAVRKQQMLACFTSQSAILQNFPVVPEQFRRAPRYDFTLPPHSGTLQYETFSWGITGARWRELAAECST
jgi:LmbE family N-acetylglucosaminyl deacetylase